MRHSFRGMSIACVATAIYAFLQMWTIAETLPCNKSSLYNTQCTECRQQFIFFGQYIKCSYPVAGHESVPTLDDLATDDKRSDCSGPTIWYGNDSTCGMPLAAAGDCVALVKSNWDVTEKAQVCP